MGFDRYQDRYVLAPPRLDRNQHTHKRMLGTDAKVSAVAFRPMAGVPTQADGLLPRSILVGFNSGMSVPTRRILEHSRVTGRASLMCRHSQGR
jgi:hypothetical protein